MSAHLAAIYVIGLVAGALFFLHAAENEPTDHGRLIRFPVGICISIFWPIFVVYLVVVAVIAGAFFACSFVKDLIR